MEVVMSANEIPDGFEPISDVESSTPDLRILEAERWGKGGVVVYRGPREWGGPGGVHRVHAVQPANGEDGELYGLWATAELDRKLKQVAIGEQIFIRHDGLLPHPTLQGKTVHRWTVARRGPSKGTAASTAPLPFA
jgi:hypothetical protein